MLLPPVPIFSSSSYAYSCSYSSSYTLRRHHQYQHHHHNSATRARHVLFYIHSSRLLYLHFSSLPFSYPTHADSPSQICLYSKIGVPRLLPHGRLFLDGSETLLLTADSFRLNLFPSSICTSVHLVRVNLKKFLF